MSKGALVAVIIAVLVIGGGAFALTRKGANTNKSEPTTTANTTATTPANDTSTDTTSTQPPVDAASTITYSNDGFSPASLTVKAGTTITVKNDSARILQFNSNPHPEHTDEGELNVGVVSPGKTKTFTVTKAGTHGFHNHLNDSHTGTIVVE